MAVGNGGVVIEMSLYMDIHRDVDASLADVEEAHECDLAVQAEHGVEYKRYWVDEANGTIFCLFEGPSKEAGDAVHEEAHGLVADETFEVVEGQ